MVDASHLIIVHTLEEVLAAMEAAEELHAPLVLQSAPDAIFYAGSLYLLGMFKQGRQQFPAVKAIFILDCADAGAETVAAMQMGHKYIRSSAPQAIRDKLADIAEQLGVSLIAEPYKALDLQRARDAKAACKEWLAAI